MASTEPLPLGFLEPSEKDFGELARMIVRSAEERLTSEQSRARLLLVPGLLFYAAFALGLELVLWTRGIDLDGTAFLAVVTATFLVMALLGQYYRDQASWTMVTRGMGRLHTVVLVQAFLLKLVTAAFFILPYKVLRNVARLFPRPARVDGDVLSVAVQSMVALDDPVAIDELAAIMPRDVTRRTLDEACLLLQWSGLAEVVSRGSRRMLLPTEGRRRLLAALPEDASPVITVSDLRRRGSTGRAAVSEPTLHELDDQPWTTPAWLQPILDRPLHMLGVVVALLVVGTLTWTLGSRSLRHLDVAAVEAQLPVVDVDGISHRNGRFFISKGSEVRITDSLDAYPTTTHALERLRKLWTNTGGMADAKAQSEVYFERIDLARADPSDRYLLVYGSWKCYKGQRVSCGTTGFVVVDTTTQTLFPANRFSGIAYGSIKGWWDEGRLLAVRSPASFDNGGGGRKTSDNLAPEAVAVDVATGQGTSLHTARERYFAAAGTDGGRRVFLAADWDKVERSNKVRFRFTEYQDLRRVHSFNMTIPAYRPVLRQAELDGSGRFWILALEFPPPEVRPSLGWKHSLWLVARRGGSWCEVTERRERGIFFLESFLHRDQPIVSLRRDTRPPTMHTYRLEER